MHLQQGLPVLIKHHFLSSQVTLTWPCREDGHPLRLLAGQTGPCWVTPKVQLRNFICKVMLSSLRRNFHTSCNNINRLSISSFCSLFPNPVVLKVWSSNPAASASAGSLLEAHTPRPHFRTPESKTLQWGAGVGVVASLPGDPDACLPDVAFVVPKEL